MCICSITPRWKWPRKSRRGRRRPRSARSREGQWSNGPTQRSVRARATAKAAETFLALANIYLSQDKSNNQAHADLVTWQIAISTRGRIALKNLQKQESLNVVSFKYDNLMMIQPFAVRALGSYKIQRSRSRPTSTKPLEIQKSKLHLYNLSKKKSERAWPKVGILMKEPGTGKCHSIKVTEIVVVILTFCFLIHRYFIHSKMCTRIHTSDRLT